MVHAFIEAMTEPIPLYFVSGSSPNEQYGAAIGDFVYVDGGVRYLDTRVEQALSTAPPLRIRIGGDVQRSKLIHKVEPTYPEEAIAAHAQGSVLLHIVIGIDGSMKEITVVKGNSPFVKAALDAVRQWRYQPTLLNDKPVEVDSTILGGVQEITADDCQPQENARLSYLPSYARFNSPISIFFIFSIASITLFDFCGS